MTILRLISIVHPTSAHALPERRFELLSDVETTILTPTGIDGRTVSSPVRRVSLPARGEGRTARFPSLASALALLDPAIVHVQADPDTLLAYQVARLGAGQRRFGLVLDIEAEGRKGPDWGIMASIRSRRVLAGTGALVARSAGAMTCMRRLGFRGVGIVAASGQDATPLLAAQEARRSLEIEPHIALVLGWAGPADLASGIVDVFEAIAACEATVVLIVVAAGNARQDLADRADALEILDRIRFVLPEPLEPNQRSAQQLAPILANQPLMAAAIGALLLGPSCNRPNRITTLKNVEFAQVHGVPVIYPQHGEYAEIVGPGGWAVPPADPGLLARLMTTLSQIPALIANGATAALSHAARRHSPEAAAADLDRAIHAVAAGRNGQRPVLEPHGLIGRLRLPFKREPSRT